MSDNLQAEFRAIQDVYSRVKLEGDMKSIGSKIGFHANQKETASVIANCAKYAETAMKILTVVDDKVGDPSYKVNNQLQELFIYICVLTRYLQEDQCLLIVGSSYSSKMQSMFRNIRRNMSVFTQDLIEDIKTASQLSSIVPEIQQTPSYRGQGYSGWSRGPGVPE